MIHLTIPEKAQSLGKACFDWCQEAYVIHDSNLQIQDLYLIVVAVVSLFVNLIIYREYDFLKIHIEEKILQKIYTSSAYLAFVMSIIFLIYIVVFR